MGTKSEPGINPCDGADSLGCPPLFLLRSGVSIGCWSGAGGGKGFAFKDAFPSSNSTAGAFSGSTGVSISLGRRPSTAIPHRVQQGLFTQVPGGGEVC